MDTYPSLVAQLDSLYSWLVDPRNDPPASAPADLIAHLQGTNRSDPGTDLGVSTAELSSGDQVAVARVDRDIILLVADAGADWRIVGAALDGLDPWLGPSPRTLLVLGSDARVGQNQLRYRADSIHLVTVVPSEQAGAIVGFPRDSWVQGPDGGIKFSSLMAGRGPEVMLDKILEMTDLPVEGYVVTGFKGFDGLIKALGGLEIDLPTKMRSGNSWANFPAGPQTLSALRALQLARIRKGLPRGDFDRSVNQGRIMLAAMNMVQVPGIDMLPEWLKVLADNAWTDLSTEDLLTLGAAVFFVSPDNFQNIVLPGRIGTAGAASVVYLDEEGAAAIYRDLEDGLLTPADDS